MDLLTLPKPSCEEHSFQSLPAEIRISILEYAFSDNLWQDGLTNHSLSGGTVIDETYSANERLRALLTCRQFYEDGYRIGFQRTNFIVSSLFLQISERLSILHPKQLTAIRNIAFVADRRHFAKVVEWRAYPFDSPDLHLDTLTIVLHRSSFWHYLFDFTTGITRILRTLKGVRRFVLVRNNALVKGSFKTWYNRLVGLVMKVDHHERYEKTPPSPEEVWWKWSFDDRAQCICLEAQPPKPLVDEETYMQRMKPLMEELKISIENEEWNPDPRCRNGA